MKSRTIVEPIVFLAAGVACWIAVAQPLPLAGWFRALLLAAGLLLALWIGLRLLRRSLWRVGRRLAFSYFLIGVVPIPIVATLIALTAYLMSGVFLGHVYRDSVRGLQGELDRAAASALARWGEVAPSPPPARVDGFRTAYYRDASRVAGDESTPERWPEWRLEADRSGPTSVLDSPFVAAASGRAAMVGTAVEADRAVLTMTDDDIEDQLSSSSGIWVLLLRSDDPRKSSSIQLSVGDRSFSLLPLAADRSRGGSRQEFFGEPGPETPWADRPFFWWGELTRDFRDLATGDPVAEYLAATLNATPRTVARNLFSGSAEVDTAIWASLLAVSSILTMIYLSAAGMAILMIVGLSRAVNQLSRATRAVREGDFSVRIRTRRRDQLGELQQTFNSMTAELEQAVRTAAHKEALESELATARDLQRSLLPTDLPAVESIDFATLFEPSAVIGGDYFDVLRIDADRLAVVIADVAGHGLPSGLRMAMLKSALDLMLTEPHVGTEEIFIRLDRLIRRHAGQRYFVTATIGIVDLGRRRLELTNAGHPPVYLLRRGEVTELAVMGTPLGLLDERYGREEFDLEAEDVLIWLSDGLFEATDPAGEPFGYERTMSELAGPSESAAVVRDRLLAAVDAFRAGVPLADDRTVLVMRIVGPPPTAAGAA